MEEETPKLTQATWDFAFGRESEVFENIGKQQIIILQSVCNLYIYIYFLALTKKTYIQCSYVDLGQKAMCSKVFFSMMFPVKNQSLLMFSPFFFSKVALIDFIFG